MIVTWMTLISPPEEIGTASRQAWDKLFEVFGNNKFSPEEGRGVLLATMNTDRNIARLVLERMVEKGWAATYEGMD